MSEEKNQTAAEYRYKTWEANIRRTHSISEAKLIQLAIAASAERIFGHGRYHQDYLQGFCLGQKDMLWEAMDGGDIPSDTAAYMFGRLDGLLEGVKHAMDNYREAITLFAAACGAIAGEKAAETLGWPEDCVDEVLEKLK